MDLLWDGGIGDPHGVKGLEVLMKGKRRRKRVVHVVNTALVDVPGFKVPGPKDLEVDEIFTVVVKGAVNCGPGFMDRGRRVMENVKVFLEENEIEGFKVGEGWWKAEVDGSGW